MGKKTFMRQSFESTTEISPETRPAIIPWIVPKADACLQDWICGNGNGNRIALKPREVLLQETHAYDTVYFVETGVIGQAVVNAALYTKPLAMNLFTAGRMMGILNILTGIAAPRRLIALAPSVVYAVPHEKARRDLDENPALFKALAHYAELCSKSELLGMELLFTSGPEDRLVMLFAALLLSEGRIDVYGNVLVHPEDSANEHTAELPYVLTRDAMRKVVYLSQITFDRLLASWSKARYFVRTEDGRVHVDVRALSHALEWIRLH